MVDHSQGHSAYSEDALVVSCMNVKPGGKQAHMHDSWYLQKGQRVIQPMKFPADHAEYPMWERCLWLCARFARP